MSFSSASVIGNGKNNIQWLIDETNKDPRRGYGHEKVLTQITIDQFTQKMLDEKIHIVSQGAKKRGHTAEIEALEKLRS